MREELEKRTVRKVFRRLMPFLGILYLVAFLDRVNVGYAALSMNQDLGFSATTYGFGAGIFFLGYFLMEVPGNLIMARVGPRLWMARILITWGIISALTAWVSTPMQFYAVRFFLGLAEASFFPGIIYYLSTWCRSRDQAKAVAFFMMALPISNIIAAPVSTYILGITWWGWHGWKWLFVLEAIPALILGIVTPFYLTNRPKDAKWLEDDERAWLERALEAESSRKLGCRRYTLREAFSDRDVLILSAIYFAWICGFYGVTLFLPLLVKALSSTLSNQAVGFVVMVPYIFGFFAMFFIGRHSDRTGERRRHTIAGLVTGAAGLTASIFLNDASVTVSMVFFTLSIMGIYGSFGPFWAIPSSFLTHSAAAGAIAMINSIGNLGGFVGPYVMGLIHDTSGSFTGGLLFLVVLLLVAAALVSTLRRAEVETGVALE